MSQHFTEEKRKRARRERKKERKRESHIRHASVMREIFRLS
jgi:hypothetical protein